MFHLLRDNVKQDGSLDTDRFVRAMLTKRNTADSYSKFSPAEIVLGRKLTDALPAIPKTKMFLNNEAVDPKWREMWHKREEAMHDSFRRNQEKIAASTRNLKPLYVGQYVLIQNQHGSQPLRWERTGVVIECKQLDQYLVKVHTKNLKALKKYRKKKQNI